MGVGIQLTGRFRKKGFLSRTPAPDKCIDAVDDWFRKEAAGLWLGSQKGQAPDSQATLGVTLHPAAESLEIIAADGGRVSVSGKTSSVGPGYHAYVCDALRKAGSDLAIDWDAPDDDAGTGDEAGYFHGGDFEAVRREMLRWLRNVAAQVLELAGKSHTAVALSMPTDVGFHHDGLIATPMGPRSGQWLREVADAPARGSDVFPWWEKGVGAPYHLGRAITRMWTEVRWRPPQGDEPRRVIDDVLSHLAAAFAGDRSLGYPWREWHELNGYIDADGPFDDIVAARARASTEADAPLIGYRRRDVTARLAGGWTIDVPGSFETVDNGDSWQAYDEKRAVYVSSLTIKGRDGGPPPAEQLLSAFSKPEGKVLQTFDHRGPRVIGRAAMTEAVEGGRTVLRLTGASAVPGGVGIVTIDLYDPSHQTWAVDTWESLDRAGGDVD